MATLRLTLALLSVIAIICEEETLASTAMLSLPSLARMQKQITKRSTTDEQRTAYSEDCIQMRNTPGNFEYVSPGSDQVCGLFIVSRSDQIISIALTELEITCDNDGLLELTDGWEINGELFPSPADHRRPVEERYVTHCGQDKPRDLFISSQNVAMLNYRIPHRGHRFRIHIEFIDYATPCSFVSMVSEGYTTVMNYGRRMNCSVLIVYPERVQVVKMDVGRASDLKSLQRIFRGHRSRCDRDYVEVLGGSGIDTSAMTSHLKACQHFDLKPDLSQVGFSGMATVVNHPYTAIRLVSSGRYENVVSVHYQLFMSPDYD